MFKLLKYTAMLFLSAIIFLSCTKKVTPQGGASTSGTPAASISSPPLIIYKTKSDFSKNVPVMLSDDKTKITSFPDIKDIYFRGQFAYPDELAGGFYLDNRGIGPNVAFLTYTYTEYQQLGKTPTIDQLLHQILDKDPIQEMFQCGTRAQYTDPVTALNQIITDGKLANCKKLK